MTKEERAKLNDRLQRMQNMNMYEGFVLHVGTLFNKPGLYAKDQIAAGIAADIIDVLYTYSDDFDFVFDYDFILDIKKEVNKEIKRRLMFK